MVHFKSYTKGTTTFLEDRDDERADGTTFPVYSPLIGPLAKTKRAYDESLHLDSWTFVGPRRLASFDQPDSASVNSKQDVLMLKSSHHQSDLAPAQFPLLCDRIRNDEDVWNQLLPVNGEFLFTECYWEWLEDVLGRHADFLKRHNLYYAVYASLFSYDRHPPVLRAFSEHWCSATNTLHTYQGEMSISLWDLDRLGGLPITGQFYDEVVPGAEEFSFKETDGKLYLSPSCKNIFSAYHKLQQADPKKRDVKIASWIRFWYRGSARYPRPPKKTHRTRDSAPTISPSGEIPRVRGRTAELYGPFEDLGLKDVDVESTYLAAFLACWLCLFVLPKGNCDCIRPGVFKAASKMAQGQTFSLAVPVLASIYQGLQQITDDPRQCRTAIPFHYVYGWLAEYFGTHRCSPSLLSANPRMVRFSGEFSAEKLDGRKVLALFEQRGDMQMHRLARKDIKRNSLHDNSTLSSYNSSYFISLRSGYLSLRREKERVVQPYSPHRFSRQFGFVQDLPGTLKKDMRSGTIEFTHSCWGNLTRLGTNSVMTLPAESDFRKKTVTQDYVTWWSKTRHVHVEKSSAPPFGKLPSPKKDKREVVDTSVVSKRKPPALLRIECSTTDPPLRDKASLLAPDLPSLLDNLEGEGESIDSPHVSGFTVQAKGTITSHVKRFHESSSSERDVHFKRQKSEINRLPLYCDPSAVYECTSSFFDDVPASSHMAKPNDEENAVDNSLRHLNDASDPIPTIAEIDKCFPLEERVPTTAVPVFKEPLVATRHPQPADHMSFSETCLAGTTTLNAEETLQNIRRQAATLVCENIEKIVMGASAKDVWHLKSELDKLIAALGHYDVDSSLIRSKVDELMADAKEYNSTRAVCKRKVDASVRSRRLAATNSEIAEALSTRQADLARRQTAIESIETLKKRQQAHEVEISQLDERLAQHDQRLDDLEKAKAEVEGVAELTAADMERIQSLQTSLETKRNSFKGLTWM